jgi:ubiquinone/menaquinone biosynthesis C-methylase UbiE
MAADPKSPEFDRYAEEYAKLLDDPIRRKFAGETAFFFERKWELLEKYLKQIGLRPEEASWLDVGCGAGELLRLGSAHFGHAVGCDVSTAMMKSCEGLQVVTQTDPSRLPFEDGSFDLVTVVCVYHHVEPQDRPALTAEIARVLRPGGTACIIEHNPFNPATQIIVRRTPVDENAQLLTARTAHRLLDAAGLDKGRRTTYFLYFPQGVYRKAKRIEALLEKVPAGGQYAAFGRKR